MLPNDQTLALRAKVFLDPSATALAHAQDNEGLTSYLNAVVPTFYVWRTSTPTQDIADAVTWANLTPTDSADGTALYTNRALVCQAKQINLQILLQGQASIKSAKQKIRDGLQDALTAIPSGAAGALLAGGWPGVKAAMTRNATLAEKMVATGTGTAASPALMTYEGTLTPNDVAVLIFKDDGTLWG